MWNVEHLDVAKALTDEICLWPEANVGDVPVHAHNTCTCISSSNTTGHCTLLFTTGRARELFKARVNEVATIRADEQVCMYLYMHDETSNEVYWCVCVFVCVCVCVCVCVVTTSRTVEQVYVCISCVKESIYNW